MADLRKTVHWLLVASLLLYVITGYGITEFRTVTALTLGIFNKAVSLKLHEALGLPFMALLLAHLYLTFMKKKKKNQKSNFESP